MLQCAEDGMNGVAWIVILEQIYYDTIPPCNSNTPFNFKFACFRTIKVSGGYTLCKIFHSHHPFMSSWLTLLVGFFIMIILFIRC